MPSIPPVPNGWPPCAPRCGRSKPAAPAERRLLPFGIEAIDSGLAGAGLPRRRSTKWPERARSRRRCRRHPVRSPESPPAAPASCSGRFAGPICSRRASPGRARPGPPALCRMRPRRGRACGDGGGASPWRARRSGRRGRARGHGLDPPAPARRRGRRDPGPDAEALAQKRRGSARPALGRGHPLADRLRALRAAAGRGGRPAALAHRARPPARRRAASMDHGGLRCRGSPRSTCRTWHRPDRHRRRQPASHRRAARPELPPLHLQGRGTS